MYYPDTKTGKMKAGIYQKLQIWKTIMRYGDLPCFRQNLELDFDGFSIQRNTQGGVRQPCGVWQVKFAGDHPCFQEEPGIYTLVLAGKWSEEKEKREIEELRKKGYLFFSRHYAGFLSNLFFRKDRNGGNKAPAKAACFFLGLERFLHPYIRLVTGYFTLYYFIRSNVRIGKEPAVSIIIPAYNESRRIGKTLESVIRYFEFRKDEFEIIVVDDGSSDNTVEVIREKSLANTRIISLYKHFGKGAAIREGVLSSFGREILLLDADGATPVEEYAVLKEQMTYPVDMAIGSRYKYLSKITIKQPWWRRFVSRAGNWYIRLFVGLPFRDTQCGFKLLHRQAALNLFQDIKTRGFGYDVELLQLARSRNFHVAEVPVKWSDQAGTKVRSIDLFRVLWEIIMIKFRPVLTFSAIGVLNTTVDFVVHNTLMLVFGLGDMGQQVSYHLTGFICANFLSYVLNSGYTFKKRGRYISFLLVSLVAMFSSLSVFYSLGVVFGGYMGIVAVNVFKLAAIVVSFTINYFGYKYIVYREQV